MEIIYLIIGILLGLLIGWLVAKLFSKKSSSNLLHDIEAYKTQIAVEAERIITLDLQVEKLAEELKIERLNFIESQSDLSAKKESLIYLQDKLNNQGIELEKLQKQFEVQFNNLANKILEEKSKKFTQQNQENISRILNPINEKLKDFEKKVEDSYVKNVKDRTDLQAEIKKLYELNSKISTEANNLTKALKGDVKQQGNWGEMVLDRILESSGLSKDREYKTQVSLNDAQGKRYQPDAIIYLPDQKHIIIDSKVSLVAYENFVNANSKEEQQVFIKDHIKSIKAHIKDLADKQYYQLEGINSPEYVLLFVPIESSFSVAIQEDAALFNFAWEHKIVVVSPSTLTATLMTISSIWQQENQTKNAIEIAKKGGALYDKFSGLINDLLDLGKKLNATQDAYSASMNKLSEGRGNLIGRAEELKTLGAKASKSLPKSLLGD